MHLLTAPRDQLLAPLQSVSGIVEKRHTLPILANVLIEKAGDQLTLLANDMEIQIKTTTAGDLGGEAAAITVSAKKLQDILRALPEGLAVNLTLDEPRLTVKAGKSRFALQTLPAQDYPKMSVVEGEGVHFSVPQKTFRALLAQVSYAMAQQDIRYYLNGLLMIAEGKLLRMVATDGHRLGYIAAGLEVDLPRTDVILPRKTVLELNRQLSDTDEPVEITLAANQIVFRFGATELISKLIDGKFPDYERVIPQGHPKVVLLERQSFLQALQRAAILSNDKLRGVRLVFSAGMLKIASVNAEQEEAQEELEIEYAYESIDLGFNVTYLLEVLNNLSAEKVELHLNDASASALVMVPGNPDFKYVVMPMRI